HRLHPAARPPVGAARACRRTRGGPAGGAPRPVLPAPAHRRCHRRPARNVRGVAAHAPRAARRPAADRRRLLLPDERGRPRHGRLGCLVRSPRLRRAWTLVAASAVAYLVGDVVQTVYELAGRRPYPSAADLFYLAFYP